MSANTFAEENAVYIGLEKCVLWYIFAGFSFLSILSVEWRDFVVWELGLYFTSLQF